MKIIDINGRERDAEDVRIVELSGTKWIRVSILQRTGDAHYEWYPVDDFKSRNPEIEIS